jgi:hypothetical protein
MSKSKFSETDLQMQICKYLKIQYPNVIFRSDFASGIKMSIGQAVRHKKMQCSRGYPDLFICEPKRGYHGLFLEIKNGKDKLYNKNGTFKKDAHIQEQAALLLELRNKGYCATFVTSFNEAKEVIDDYMK